MGKVFVTVEGHDGMLKSPKFYQCVVDLFQTADSEKNNVTIALEENPSQNKILLKNPSDKTHSVIFAHPSFCPIKAITNDFNATLASERVPCAVSCLVESSDNNILLTRRSLKLRSFPGVWVTPGGFVDEGESLSACGLRELYEETGLDFRQSKVDISNLCLWESAFPPIISMGAPKRHCIVVYHHIKIPQASNELESFNLSQEEVDMVTWLDKSSIRSIVNQNNDHSKLLKCFIPNEDGKGVKSTSYQLENLCRRLTVQDDEANGINDEFSERVATGVRFALKIWLNL